MKHCKHLERWARDSEVPVSYHADSNSYSLDLTPELSVPNMFCIFCGGQGWPDLDKTYPQCDCGRLREWAANADIPIQFDKKMNEYHLILPTGAQMMIYFCPVCGKRTPKSKRCEFFTTPSEKDIKRLKNRLQGAKTMSEVIAALGEPDERHGSITYSKEKKAIYNSKDIKQCIGYNRLSKTAHVSVVEYEDGSIEISYSGKSKSTEDS